MHGRKPEACAFGLYVGSFESGGFGHSINDADDGQGSLIGEGWEEDLNLPSDTAFIGTKNEPA
jgi:hypothetical protein